MHLMRGDIHVYYTCVRCIIYMGISNVYMPMLQNTYVHCVDHALSTWTDRCIRGHSHDRHFEDGYAHIEYTYNINRFV